MPIFHPDTVHLGLDVHRLRPGPPAGVHGGALRRDRAGASARRTWRRPFFGSAATNDSPALRQMSTINHATAAFPPALISGGNDDPLTEHQSKPPAAKVQGLGVEVTPLFYPPDHKPGLAHEYQFDRDNADGRNALTQMLGFLKQSHVHTGADVIW